MQPVSIAAVASLAPPSETTTAPISDEKPIEATTDDTWEIPQPGWEKWNYAHAAFYFIMSDKPDRVEDITKSYLDTVKLKPSSTGLEPQEWEAYIENRRRFHVWKLKGVDQVELDRWMGLTT